MLLRESDPLGSMPSSVTRGTSQLDVRNVMGTAVTHSPNVIELKELRTSAVHTKPAVATPNLPLHGGRDEPRRSFAQDLRTRERCNPAPLLACADCAPLRSSIKHHEHRENPNGRNAKDQPRTAADRAVAYER